MNADQSKQEANEVNDAQMLELIIQLAKPTVTLTQLKQAATKFMEDLEIRGSLGRLWRSVKIYRHALTPSGVVLYWPEETARAVNASGIHPDMPEGAALPDYVHPNPKKEISQEYRKQETQDEVKKEGLTRKEENARKSRWQLVPISQTAALPMRPLAKGVMGGIHRDAVTSDVASALFIYRDLRLSIDAVASLIPHRTRTDVARVISQCVNGMGKKYFVRFPGETRFDNTYQWNFEFAYPFCDREPDDGKCVQRRNIDPEVEDDDVLDHIPAKQLSEVETESEIARLIAGTIPEPIVEEPVKAKSMRIDHSGIGSSNDGVGTCGIGSNLAAASVNVNEVLDAEPKNVGIPVAKRESDSERVSVTESDGVRRVSVTTGKFRTALFNTGELVLYFDNSQIELTPEQTDQVMTLLGPQFYARKMKAS